MVYNGSMEQPSLFDTTKLGKLVVQPQLAIKLPTPQSTVLETLPAYYAYLKSGDYSAYTVDDFTGDIKKLGLYLPKKAVATVSLVDLRQWIRFLASPTGEQLQAKTVSRKVAAVKNYFQWLKNSRVLQADPTVWLLTQRITLALAFARARAGNNMPARMAMIAITTSNSISVKARLLRS